MIAICFPCASQRPVKRQPVRGAGTWVHLEGQSPVRCTDCKEPMKTNQQYQAVIGAVRRCGPGGIDT